MPLLPIGLALIMATAAAATADPALPEQAVDALFADLDSSRSPGCAVGVVRSGELELNRGYGLANLEYGIAIGPTSAFRIASLSKQFTAATLLVLEAQGVLGLEEDVREYLPELPDHGARITLRHLIDHTSGMRDYLALMRLAGHGLEHGFGESDVLAMAGRQRALNFQPGERFQYSNTGYFLLSQVVYRATGTTLSEAAQALLFEPLGMRRTHFHDDPSILVPGRASGYAPQPEGGYRNKSTRLPLVGDGGVFTTLEDMAIWERVFTAPPARSTDPELAAYLAERMVERGVLSSGDAIDYAFGMWHDTHRGEATMVHGGAFLGYRAAMVRVPAQALSIVLLCNLSTARPGQRLDGLLDVLLEGRLEAEAPAVDDASARPGAMEQEVVAPPSPVFLDRLAGTYWSEELGVVYRFEVREGLLTLVQPSRLATQLESLSAGAFGAGWFQFRFQLGRQGPASGFELDARPIRGIGFERVDANRARTRTAVSATPESAVR